MGLRLFFMPKFPGATFIQGVTFIPDSRVSKQKNKRGVKSDFEKKMLLKTRLWYNLLIRVMSYYFVAIDFNVCHQKNSSLKRN